MARKINGRIDKVLALREQAAKEKQIVTERAGEIFEFLYDFHLERGYMPTYRQIGEACNITTTSLVSHYLSQLENAGYIRRSRGVSRGIVLLREKEPVDG